MYPNALFQQDIAQNDLYDVDEAAAEVDIRRGERSQMHKRPDKRHREHPGVYAVKQHGDKGFAARAEDEVGAVGKAGDGQLTGADADELCSKGAGLGRRLRIDIGKYAGEDHQHRAGAQADDFLHHNQLAGVILSALPVVRAQALADEDRGRRAHGNKDDVEQVIDGVLIEAEDDRVTLTCSDGSLNIESINAADVRENGRVVLPGRLFNELIRKLPGGVVTITVNDDRTANVKCMKSRTNMACMNAMEYPEIQEMDKGIEVKIPQKKLKDMISHVVFSIATDENRQILTGCLMEVSRNEARLVALDGFRLAIQKVFQPFELPEGMESLRAIIPGKVMNELSRILMEDESFCKMIFNGNRMRVSFGNIRFSAVLLSGEYIDYKRILPEAFKTEAKANKAGVQDAIERASLMAREGKNNLIKISIRKDSLVVSSNAEMGDIVEEMDACLNGEEVDIAFNAKYIMDVIRNISDDELNMKFNSNVSPCVFLPKEGEDFLYLILPVRTFQ